MARDISNQVQYYYDSHPTEEDLMGETSWHVSLIDYLKAVLIWLFPLRLTRDEAQALMIEQVTERAAEEAKRTQALAEKLRSLGIDPDEMV